MTAPEHRNILGQGWKASIRLNLQHWAVKDRYGYLVHPSIGVSSSTEPYRIADFGASTARWAIELGIELNASGIKNQVDGFDISTEQFPHPAWIPDNIKLHKQDVLAPFPEEYRARYDVVQIRAFASIATEKIVHQLLDSVTWLLKPNGYLQWVDMDPYKTRIVTAKPGTKHPEADKLLGFLRSPPGGETVFSFLPHIDSLCAKRDLATTVKEDLPLRDIDRPLWNQNLAMAHEEFLLRGKLSRDEVNVCLERLIAEFKTGVAFHAETFIVVAQKGL